MWNHISRKWNQYRYRFVPWLALNLKDRTSRSVPKGHPDKIISDDEVSRFLIEFLTCLHESQDATGPFRSPEKIYHENINVMRKQLGFVTQKTESDLLGGGYGVKVTTGTVEPGQVVSMYPGTLYQPYDAILLASLGNPFIFRCLDGLMIDGNDRAISKMIYKSCCGRDRVGLHALGDQTWLSPFPVNPLAVGQYVNNQSKRFPANVAYQEFNIPVDFPLELRQYIPNVWISNDPHNNILDRETRVVVLVSTRQILAGEDLFSSYFTIVQ